MAKAVKTLTHEPVEAIRQVDEIRKTLEQRADALKNTETSTTGPAFKIGDRVTLVGTEERGTVRIITYHRQALDSRAR